MIFIYNSLFSLVLGLLLKSKLHIVKYKKMYIGICFFQMILIQGLREITVGTDTSYYVGIYNNYKSSEYYSFLFTHFESGFKLLYNIFSGLKLDSQMMLFIVSAFTMIGFAVFIYNNSEDVVISTFIFTCLLYPNSFNILRQYLAMAIACNSFKYCREKQYTKAIVLIIAASFFHTTAILFLIPIVFSVIKNWKLMRYCLILCTVVFFLFGNIIITVSLEFLGKQFYLQGYNVNRIFRLTTFLTIVYAFLSWYFSNSKELKEEHKNTINILANVAFVNVLFGILYLKYEFVSRMIELLNLWLMISVPLWIEYSGKRYYKLFRYGVVVWFFLLMIIFVYNSEANIAEYYFFFQKH